ncbi:MAG: RdgB/HAM1 family non-canonical purine NTP pyrophosphatase [Bacteroidia bacterium]|nr:RdgB/HAM1 family non-canonical purine NTP pyrophosphatase [Bacteroidia bacterium]MCF8446298.1 RdgB/HAM1 family non-canonical purine NTP pyrophosphatase [Bacteroidia bacterium]
MEELIFASHNSNKTKEIGALLGDLFQVVSLTDIGFNQEIIENGLTLKENAWIKASTINKQTSKNCFADDTGLLVDALNGEPGVYSARYAGPEKSDQKNMDKLLTNLSEKEIRTARFVTVICLIYKGENYFFEGACEGEIIKEKRGTMGFGYDPIFLPTGLNKTLAELTLDEKNKISHRAIAFRKMEQFLSGLNQD